MAKPKKGGLGKGLEALFADNDTQDVAVTHLKITEIEPNASQPRREFSPEALAELSDSIKEHGVLQPLVVRPRPNGRYQIVAGERRWRAARQAGLAELPVVVRELTDSETLEIALVENLIREDLNPIEEAAGYRSLLESFSMTQEEVARRVGRSRSAVANAIRLLSLPSEVVELVERGEMTPGHARAIAGLEKKEMLQAAERIVREGLSVRQAEKLFLQPSPRKKEPQKKIETDSYYREMQLALSGCLKRKVKVNHSGEEKGQLVIDFYSKEELKELGEKLTK